MMRRPLPRFNVRWLMAVVAFAACSISIAVEGERLVSRSRHNRTWSTLHGGGERDSRAMLIQVEGEIERCRDPAVVLNRWKRSGMDEDCLSLFIRDDSQLLRQASILRRMVAYHAEMRQRFERAAWLPWKSVVIDPMPEWEL
jgi:hypothetical protein